MWRLLGTVLSEQAVIIRPRRVRKQILVMTVPFDWRPWEGRTGR